jgi:hypothetical protein
MLAAFNFRPVVTEMVLLLSSICDPVLFVPGNIPCRSLMRPVNVAVIVGVEFAPHQ